MYKDSQLKYSNIGDDSPVDDTCIVGTTPGRQFRLAMAIGVTPDLGVSQTMFDDDQNLDSVDPHADIRTDWRMYSNNFEVSESDNNSGTENQTN